MIQHVPKDFDSATQPTVDVVDSYDEGHRSYCDLLRRHLGAHVRIRVFDDPTTWFAQVSPTDLPDVIVCGNRFRGCGAEGFVADLRRREVLVPVFVYTGGVVRNPIPGVEDVFYKPDSGTLIRVIKRRIA